MTSYVCADCRTPAPMRRVRSGVGGRLYDAAPLGCRNPECVNYPRASRPDWVTTAE